MRKRTMWIGGGIVVLFAAVGGILLLRAPSVELAKPERGLAVEAVYATGTVEPVQYTQTGSKVPGRVAELKVKEGDRVKQGDVLAALDLEEEASNVDQLQAKLELARSDVERTRRLRRTGNISIAALDQAESAFGAAQAALRAARAKLDDRYIRAPIAGVVLRSDL